MNAEEIIVNPSGVAVLGFPVGLAPTAHDFDLALEGETVRALPPLGRRQLRICDRRGLSWLVDLKSGRVLWLDILLAPFRHRPQDDHNPASVFKGKVCIGQYTIQGPFSFETGEIVRNVVIANIGINLVPAEKRIHAVTLAFEENERQLGARELT